MTQPLGSGIPGNEIVTSQAKFETALEAGKLSGDSRSVVERAYQSVRAGHDQMSQLKHGMESNA